MVAPLGDALIERIREGGTADDVHQLIAEFGSGYPVSRLKQLFGADRDEAVTAGAWIASELGPFAASLLEDLGRLLTHRSRQVRAYTLDAILLAASASDGRVIAQAICLIDDEDAAVRWKAMHFLARATSEQLRSAMRHLLDFEIAAALKWLIDVTSRTDTDEILQAVNSDNVIRRRFAAAAAVRVVAVSNVALIRASASADAEISSFAREWLS